MDVVMMQGMANENGVAKTSVRVSCVATAMIVPVLFRRNVISCFRRRVLMYALALVSCIPFASMSARASYQLDEGAGVEVCEAFLRIANLGGEGGMGANERRAASHEDTTQFAWAKWDSPSDGEPYGPLWDYVEYLWDNEIDPTKYIEDVDGKTKLLTSTHLAKAKKTFLREQANHSADRAQVTWFDLDNDGVKDLFWRNDVDSEFVVVVNRTYTCPTCNPTFTWDRARTLRMFQHRSWKARGGKSSVLSAYSGFGGTRYRLFQHKSVSYFAVTLDESEPLATDQAARDFHREDIYRMQGKSVVRLCSFRF